ncbi:MAG: GNAT family N-acetyltransferase, partial [Chloroflexi bacterium]|nr:GNAT family N-acetyltransferase [Chloroflexota bacterium]
VHPHFQNRGIGTHMYTFVLDWLKGQGMKVISVSTGGDPSHAPARRAYEKAGFTCAIPSVRYYLEI